MKIAIVPPSKDFYNNKFFDIHDPSLNRDNSLLPYYELKKELKDKNIDLNTIDLYDDIKKVDLILFFILDYKYLLQGFLNNLEDRMVYFAWEPEVVDKNHSKENLWKLKKYFSNILTWNDEMVDGVNFLKVNYPYPFKNDGAPVLPFNQKKLLTNISGHKFSNNTRELYSEREKVINYFEAISQNKKSDEFTFYGLGWPKEKYLNYGGKVDSKFKTYGQYKFAVSFENMKNVDGYITEKILDCFVSSIVPIYWGADNITKYIPEGCFIDYRKFSSIKDLVDYLREMTEEEYQTYLTHIHAYLSSEAIYPFTSQAMRDTILNIMEQKNNRDRQFKVSKVDKLKLTYAIINKAIIKVTNKVIKR